jgi:serine phosphatase RsbU (regulator of sigma subunit)
MPQLSQDSERDDRTHLVESITPWTSEEAPDEFEHYLLVIEGLDPGRRFTVKDRPVTIGRVPPADIVLADTEISRRHCTLEIVGGEVVVTDLGSTNGCFVDGKRITAATRLPNGGMLRVGRQNLRYEYRSRLEVAASAEIERDLREARTYVESLLPPRLTDGPVRTDWLFEPSARIGGDALGYHAVDDNHFALYLIDIAGHGARAALHAASVINVMRKQALPGVDMRYPEQVLRGLNAMFPMEEHGDLFFTAWYGVYLRQERQLRYCAGGHHPGYLVGPRRDAAASLWTRNPILGMRAGQAYEAASTRVVPGSSLYLFSDGVFEVEVQDGKQQALEDFVPLLLEAGSDSASETERLVGEMRRRTGRKIFEDDLTLLVATFP